MPRTYSILKRVRRKSKNVLGDRIGCVELLDLLPSRDTNRRRPTADHAIIDAARVSYQKGTVCKSNNEDLIRYMFRHQHLTPFEVVRLYFYFAMPLFVVQQLLRHRTAHFCTVNQESLRYSVASDQFYAPRTYRKQKATNKQGSNEDKTTWFEDVRFARVASGAEAKETYEYAINTCDMAREQARMILPTNQYTQLRWSIDLRNLFHFLELRCDHAAQLEIRVYADAIHTMLRRVVPLATRAWEDYSFNSLRLSSMEVTALKCVLVLSETQVNELVAGVSENKREQQEFREKLLGLVRVGG
jgi:thymidylate synthase (FAD)